MCCALVATSRPLNLAWAVWLFAARAFALEFAIEFAFGLAGFASESLEGFFFVEVGLGLETGDFGGEAFPVLRIPTWGTRLCSGFSGCLDEEDEFAADAIAGGEIAADFCDGAAEELFVELGEFAGGDDAQRWSEDGFEIGEGVSDAVRGFVEDDGLRGSRGWAARSSRRVRRAPAFSGRNPRKGNRRLAGRRR